MIALSIGKTDLTQSNRAAWMLPLIAVVLPGTAFAQAVPEVYGSKASEALISQARDIGTVTAVDAPAPIKPTLITTPKPVVFPGMNITLTQPVNVLQPIPAAAANIPQTIN